LGKRIWLAMVLAFAVTTTVNATEDGAEVAIRTVLEKQVADWNRADIPAFVETYAEDCTFVGKSVVEGREQLRERYRRNYPTPAAMGHLTFSDLKIKKIDKQAALVTGQFHLQRTQDGGGDASGIFSLVLARRGGVWRIVLDHTS
jgi:uncharacterized protein (TIGR02246 family)